MIGSISRQLGLLLSVSAGLMLISLDSTATAAMFPLEAGSQQQN